MAGEIYQPWNEIREEERQRARQYYGGADKTSDDQIVEWIYNDDPLADRFKKVELQEIDYAERELNFVLRGAKGKSDLTLVGISFRQLLVESSGSGSVGSRWEGISPQRRLEICQSELARWSVIFRRADYPEVFKGAKDVTQVELINNWTSTRSFHKHRLAHGRGRDGLPENRITIS